MTTVEQLAEQTQTQPSGLTIGFNEEEKLLGARIAKGVPSFDDVLQGKIKNIGTTNFQKFRLNNQEYTLQELLKLPNGQNILKNKYDSIINQPPELQDPNAPDILFKEPKVSVVAVACNEFKIFFLQDCLSCLNLFNFRCFNICPSWISWISNEN